MGYTNKDKRWVRVTAKDKRIVKRKRRAAERRETRGEHLRSAARAMPRGWYYS